MDKYGHGGKKSLKAGLFLAAMKLAIQVNILTLIKFKPKHHCQQRQEQYKIASCFLGQLTTDVEKYLVKQGYRRMGIESSLEKATYLFKKIEREDLWAKVIQVLVKEPLIVSVTIEVEREEIAGVQALLKSLDVPKDCFSLVH